MILALGLLGPADAVELNPAAISILKRGGRLTAMNTEQIATEAAAANAALRKRSNWW
jgi:hypothetical protein